MKKQILGITLYDPAIVTVENHEWSDGDEVVIEGSGAAAIDGRWRLHFCTTNTFTLYDIGTGRSVAAKSIWSWRGRAAGKPNPVVELACKNRPPGP